jgi:antitoxin component of MazEF toxin-antitoxin module
MISDLLRALCASVVRFLGLARWGHSLAIRLPVEHLRAAGPSAGDALHLAVALDAGVSHIATTDAVLDANARKHGLASVGF